MHLFRKKKTFLQKLTQFIRPLQDIKILILAIAVIMVWRGVWNLLDHYLLPNNFVASSILSIAIGTLILFLNNNNLVELGIERGDE